jgi:hypothetical protein
MLKRIVALAGSAPAPEGDAAGGRGTRDLVAPSRILDGFGVFGPPPPTARPVASGFAGRATFDHPPGFYGPPEGLLAVNALAPADRLARLDVSALTARREAYRMSEPQDLRGPVMLAALLLLALDAIVVFWLSGGIGQSARRRDQRRPKAATTFTVQVLALFAALTLFALFAHANDDQALKSTLETRLGYVITGDAEADRVSKAGPDGLTRFLAQRTALKPAIRSGLIPPVMNSPTTRCLLAGRLARRSPRAKRSNASTPT